METLIKDSVKANPQRFTKIKERLIGITTQTTLGLRMLQGMEKDGDLFSAVINVKDSIAKSKVWVSYLGFNVFL